VTLPQPLTRFDKWFRVIAAVVCGLLTIFLLCSVAVLDDIPAIEENVNALGALAGVTLGVALFALSVYEKKLYMVLNACLIILATLLAVTFNSPLLVAAGGVIAILVAAFTPSTKWMWE